MYQSDALGFSSHSLTRREVVHFSLYIIHDDAHSRSVLAEYVDGATRESQTRVVYEDPAATGGGGLGDLLQRALAKKGRKD